VGRGVSIRWSKVELSLEILGDLFEGTAFFEIQLGDEWAMPPPFLAGIRVGGTLGRLTLPINWGDIGRSHDGLNI